MSDDNEYTCPHCQADLRAKPIPPEQQAAFGNKSYFSRLMVINDHDTSYNCCPDCKVVWDVYSGAICTDEFKKDKWLQQIISHKKEEQE